MLLLGSNVGGFSSPPEKCYVLKKVGIELRQVRHGIELCQTCHGTEYVFYLKRSDFVARVTIRVARRDAIVLVVAQMLDLSTSPA
jgi:hypothetical protein